MNKEVTLNTINYISITSCAVAFPSCPFFFHLKFIFSFSSFLGERPFPCTECGKPFRVRSDMKRHLNTHYKHRNANTSNVEDCSSQNIPSSSVVDQSSGVTKSVASTASVSGTAGGSSSSAIVVNGGKDAVRSPLQKSMIQQQQILHFPTLNSSVHNKPFQVSDVTTYTQAISHHKI